MYISAHKALNTVSIMCPDRYLIYLNMLFHRVIVDYSITGGTVVIVLLLVTKPIQPVLLLNNRTIRTVTIF